MSSNDGGPAFPAKRPEKVKRVIGSVNGKPVEADDEEFVLADFPGMSLRDWFAGQAIGLAWQAYADGYYESEDPSRSMAEHAYQVADAMLAARNSPKPNGEPK